MKKIISVLVVLLLALTCLFACSPTVEIVNVNTEKTFRTLGTWEKSGIRNHYNGGTGIGPLETFAIEGLYQYVRSTDEIVPMLADGPIDHISDTESVIKIKQNAKWQNGDDFLAEDVLSFYWLNHTIATNYMKDIQQVDNKTVKIIWNANRPLANEVKNLLIAQDKQGTAQYAEFKEYADRAKSILDASPEIADDSTTWGAFNKFSTTEQIKQLEQTLADYKNHNPQWFIATGAFKPSKISETQMLLVKNQYHWNADVIEFEKIEVYSSSDLNQTYQLAANNKLDYLGDVPQLSTIHAILNKNKNLVHLKMYDPGAIGIVFNMEKPIWTDKVREAFQYIFNREEIKNAGNPCGVTAWGALQAMAPAEAQKWMRAEDYAKIKTYEYDENKAESLLKEAGWQKVNNKWTVNGTAVKLYLGYDQDHAGHSGVAEAVASALNNFGIEVVMKKASYSAWYATAIADNSAYDFTVAWTDLNMSFSYPTGSFKNFQNVTANLIHAPKYPDNMTDENGNLSPLAGNVNLTFEKIGGGEISFSETIDVLYSKTGEELKDIVGSFVLGIANRNYGVQFYQNVAGAFCNKGMVAGLPLQSYWEKDRNVTYIAGPNDKEFFDVAKVNMAFANSVLITYGQWTPTK